LGEIGFNQGWLAREQPLANADQHTNSGYGEYLIDILGDAE